MKYLNSFISREKSCITGNHNLEHLYTHKNFPIFMGCTSDDIVEDIVADMSWFIDPKSGFIQLKSLVPLDILYKDQHMDATGSTWTTYNNELTKFILNHYQGNILEIGGGSGKLANQVLSLGKKINKYLVVEPNPLFKETERLKVKKTFFTKKLILDFNEYNTIVLSQVLEHVYDPRDFLKQVYDFLPMNGKFIFGYPNLEYLFSNNYTNAINFEHSFLMTEYFVDFLLSEIGFKINEKINFENHSHFYCVEKIEYLNDKVILVNKYEHYKKMFNEFIDFHLKLVTDLNNYLKLSEGPFFLFGAHIFSQYLFNFGLNNEKIKFVLDNSPIKIGKRLYGTELYVQSPTILSDYENPVVILKAGLYNEEIKEDILKNINSKTIFI